MFLLSSCYSDCKDSNYLYNIGNKSAKSIIANKVRSKIQHPKPDYLQHWSTFFTQQHVVVGISEIRRPHPPVTTSGVNDCETIIDLTFVKQSALSCMTK